MEVKGYLESCAGADRNDRGGFKRGPQRGRAKVAVRSDRRRRVMVEAEHEDVERVYQGQVDVMLKSIFLPPFPYSLGTLTDYHVSVAKLYAHTLY